MAIDDFGVEEPKNTKDRAALINKHNQLYKNVFRSPDGSTVLTDFIDKFYKHTSHTPGDPYTTAYKEGQRAVVIYILSRIEKAENTND